MFAANQMGRNAIENEFPVITAYGTTAEVVAYNKAVRKRIAESN